MRCTLLGFFLAASLLAAADPSYQLVKAWQVDLPAQSSVAAVCPDGMFYMSAPGGQMSVVNEGGRLVSVRQSAVFKGATAMACTANRLFVARPGRLLVFTRTASGELAPLTSAPHAPWDVMAAAGDDLLFTHGPTSRALYAIDAQGKLLCSFRQLRDRSMIGTGRDYAGVFLFWDEASQHLVCINGRPYGIEVYSRDGRLVDQKTPGPQSRFQLISRGRRPFLGKAEGVARLPDGRIVIQVANLGQYNGWGSNFLQVFDSKLNYLSDELPAARLYPARPGRLVGASANGDLYFVNASPSSVVMLVKARIE